jgi:PAS domain S-box-containing protein
VQVTEEMLRAVLASLTATIAVVNRSGVIVAVNPAWEKFAEENGGDPTRCSIGVNYLDICRRASSGLSDASVAELVGSNLKKLLEGDCQHFTCEYPCHSRCTQRWFALVATPLKHDQGGAVIAHFDITDRKRAEIALSDRKERLQTILNTVSDAIVTTDQFGCIESVNRATEKMFCASADTLLNQSFNQLVVPPNADGNGGVFERSVMEIVHGSPPIHCEVKARRQDGSTFPMDLTANAVNQMRLFTFIMRDVTKQKRLQKQLLKIASCEQRRIGQELHDGVQQEVVGLSFLAESVIANLQHASLEQVGNDRDWTMNQGAYEKTAQTLQRLKDGLNQTGKNIQELARGIVPVPIDPKEFQCSLSELVQKLGSQQPIRCSFVSVGEISALNHTTAFQLYRIVQEAVGNALRHSEAENIVVQVAHDKTVLIAEIIDDGKGIDQRCRTFKRSLNEGIGLSIMEYRANAIGGTLAIEETVNGGTTIRVAVPIGSANEV